MANEWDDTYKGPRWTYGLRYRPLGYGTAPQDYIIHSDRTSAEFRFGTIDYPRELTEAEVAAYQLEIVQKES